MHKYLPYFSLGFLLVLGTCLPAFAIQSCSSDNTACVSWQFYDQNGMLSDKPPSDITIDTSQSTQADIKWVVTQETGTGAVGFDTHPDWFTGGKFWIQNCPYTGIHNFGGPENIQFIGPVTCTITANGGTGEGVVKMNVIVTSGKSTNLLLGQEASSYKINVHVIPEFGQISMVMLVVLMLAVIVISTKAQKPHLS